MTTSIERTAYPRFGKKQQFHKSWLINHFSLKEEDIKLIKRRGSPDEYVLALAIKLKTFQYLGYFEDIENVPEPIINTIRSDLSFNNKIKPVYNNDKSKYRHHDYIRDHLNIIKWKDIPPNEDKDTQRLAIEFAYNKVLIMNNPADILNATIEYLKNENYELPAFSTVDRLVRHVRNIVHNKIYNQIYLKTKGTGLISQIDNLLNVLPQNSRAGYNLLKLLPKKPTISNLRELINHYNWLIEFGNIDELVSGVADIKLTQLAEYVSSLDVGDVKEFAAIKKYALVTVLIGRAQKESKDAIATTFCKIIFKMHADAKRALEELRDKHSKTTKDIADVLKLITEEIDLYDGNASQILIDNLLKHYSNYNGGIEQVAEDCRKISAYNSKNYFPLLWSFFKNKRSTLFNLLEILNIASANQNNDLIHAMRFIYDNRMKKTEHIEIDESINISFATEEWKKLIFDCENNKNLINRKNLEVCVFSNLASDLKSGDAFINGANSYDDFRKNLLPWEQCQNLLSEFCKQVELPENKTNFINQIRERLKLACKKADTSFPDLNDVYIDENGYPKLKKKIKNNAKYSALLEEIRRRMPERKLLDIMCNMHQLIGWADVFGPLMGNEPKIKDAVEKYVINVFSNGTGMGPSQTVRHIKTDDISVHVLSKINRRHVNLKKLNQAMTKLINYSNTFSLSHLLGDKNKCGTDGTVHNIFDDNLLATTHYRYQTKGAIAYHHISDTYIALFSTFIPCGVWEAVEIIESLLKNDSAIQPKIVHADTQGQSSIVFGLSYLFNIHLMPRIRNFKELKFFKANGSDNYKHIEELFDNNVINWNLLETHWQDLMQVAISIKEGKISSSTLLRKLTNDSKKNKLFKAFRELGNVIRTIFLLDYISDVQLRDSITETTNKVESYNAISDWCMFGSKYITASNDPNEMEKAIKYNSIIVNCIVIQNLIDISAIIYKLQQEGCNITKDEVKRLSPYLTEHIKRFGDYLVNMVPAEIIPNEIRELKVA